MSVLFWILLALAWLGILAAFALRSSSAGAAATGLSVASLLVWCVEAGVIR